MSARRDTPAKSVSYEEYVLRVVSQMTKDKGAIDQLSLRESIYDCVPSLGFYRALFRPDHGPGTILSDPGYDYTVVIDHGDPDLVLGLP